MNDMMDYLAWRGDLPLTRVPLNTLDALILANYCYTDLTEDIADGKSMMLFALAPLLPPVPTSEGKFIHRCRELFLAMADSARFGSLMLHDYVNVRDEQLEMQFAAVTCDLPTGERFISFRGTDSSVVGWHEDFNMTYESPVPAQTAALGYLEKIAADFDGPIFVAGHSKGGNLAAYCAIHATGETQQRIAGIYSFDGPGLDEDSLASESYERIKPVLHSIIPQGSLVGLLMAYHPVYTIVKSDAVGIFQHDPFTWHVQGKRLVEAEALDAGSQVMERALHEWLLSCDKETRRQIVVTLFKLMKATEAQILSDVIANVPTHIPQLRETVRSIDPENLRAVTNMLATITKLSADNAAETIIARAQKFLQAEKITLLPLPALPTLPLGAPKAVPQSEETKAALLLKIPKAIAPHKRKAALPRGRMLRSAAQRIQDLDPQGIRMPKIHKRKTEEKTMFNVNSLEWTREPKAASVTPEKIEITTAPGTDLWQRTYYHFRNDNAPVLQMRTSDPYFSFVVKTEFDSHHRFDQCGVVLYLDSDNWLKASIEYENEEIQHLGSVVTNHGYSDWATTEIPADIKSMWYRLSRREDDYRLECSVDGEHFSQMRVCHLYEGNREIRFGIYACSPEDSSFTATFTHMDVTECQWLAHDGQQPDAE